MRLIAAVLAVVGALLIAEGVALMFAPAGLLVLGVECIAGAYGVAYLTARR